ncbi:MAG: ABC transporter substrate-binding protein [Streptosporangiaceae bacterium]|jgi:NitT/TauT family transport system substrate-binding protein
MRLAVVKASTLPLRASRQRARTAIALISAALLIAGCQLGSSSASGGTQGTLTVGVVQGIGNAPLYIGLEQGLFRQHGLSVTVKSFDTATAEFSALTSGRIDVAAGDYADFLYKESTSGTSLRLIADGYDAAPNVMEVLTLPNSGITTPADLQNKKVATPEPDAIPASGNGSISGVPYSMEMLATESVLESDGVSPSAVTWKPTAMQNMLSELSSGKVDAILVTEPYIFEAEARLGATEVLDSCSGVTAGLPLSGYFSLSSFAQRNGPNLRAFQAAVLAAQTEAAMRGPVTAALPRAAGMTAQDAALVSLGVYPTFLNIGQVQRVAQLLYDAGVTSSLVDVRGMASG